MPEGTLLNSAPSAEQIRLLREYFQEDRLTDAELLARSLATKFPSQQIGWKVLGAILKKTGRLNEALKAEQRSVQLAIKDAEAHNNLGVTLQQLDRMDAAETHFKKAITLQPDYAEGHCNLGDVFHKRGRLEESEASYKRALALKPDFTEAHNKLGNALKSAGKLDECVKSYKRAIALKRDCVEAHNNLGNALHDLGRLNEAEICFRRAIEFKPSNAEVHNNLGATLKERGKLDEAEACFRQAIIYEPNLAQAFNNLGSTLQELGQLSEAEASYRAAMELRPAYAEAQTNLGNTLRSMGRLEEAKAIYSQAIALQPDCIEAYHALSAIKKFDTEDRELLQLRALYQNNSISEERRCQICFALATVSENLDDFATAFECYSEGNALRKKHLGHDRALVTKSFERLKYNSSNLAANTLEKEDIAPAKVPIFIVGMPRSGTTLVEQIISSHSLVAGGGELPFIASLGGELASGVYPTDIATLQQFREQYLSATRPAWGRSIYLTDKMPQNFRFLGLIAAVFPEAKIIHVKRRSAAVIWANYTMYFAKKGLSYCYSLDDILHYHDKYSDLMRYWKQSLGERIYDLEYESLTVNQNQETRKLIKHLDLSWEDACLSPQSNKRYVNTASSVQVRQQIYQGSSERWERYRPYLNGALDHLGSR